MKPSVDSVTTIAMMRAPIGPNATLMTSDAGALLKPRAGAPSTCTQTMLTATYIGITMQMPASNPRGNVRLGSFVSPITYVALRKPL